MNINKINWFNYKNYNFKKKLIIYKNVIEQGTSAEIKNLIDYIINYDISFIKSIRHKKFNKNVAVITGSACGSGSARVCCDLCNILSRIGYKIVFILENKFTHLDYYIDKNIIKESLFNCSSRNIKLIDILKKHNISTVIHNETCSGYISNDLVILKLLKIKCLLYLHKSFSQVYIYHEIEYLYDFIKQLYIADCLLVTNKLDYEFYKPFSNNIYYILHSIDYIKKTYGKSKTNKLNSSDIIYIARGYDPIKRLNDIIPICLELKKTIEDFRLMILGKVNSGFLEKIKTNNLEQNIIMRDYVSNVSNFLTNSKIFISTSAGESFGMSIAEAMYYGKPIVMYNLPFLPLTQSKGILSTNIGDYKKMAYHLHNLITNKNYQKYMGEHNRKYILNLYRKQNNNKIWKTILNNNYYSSQSKFRYIFEIFPGNKIFMNEEPKSNKINLSIRQELRIFLLFIPRVFVKIIKKFILHR